MTQLLSPRALRSLRKTMGRFMVDTLEFYRLGEQQESTFDPVTLTSVPKEGDLVYSGPGRVRPTRGPKEVATGESVMVMRDADFSLPWDAPEILRDDMCKITASEDEQLVGRWFRVTDVVVSGQKATRKCSGVQIQSSRLWPNG